MPPLAAQGASSEFAATSAADQSNEKTSKSRTIRVLQTVKHHVKHHVGIGIVCSVAYFDPGNWSVDLQAGSQFGYRPLLFIILLAGLGAIILQSLASKLGCVTGQDLASHCRLLLHDRPNHRKLVRYSILYPLYVLSEIGIVCTDLAELLGSAIGLCLLFPSIPLWAAVLVTAADVLVFLVIGGPTRGGKPVKVFEYVIIALVFTVFACFIVLLVQVKPQWSSVFLGYIPSEKLFDTHTDVLYIAVGILGATVMPHALFLGSFLATQDRTASTVDVSLPHPIQTDEKAASYTPRARLRTWFKSLFDVSRAERIAASREYRTKYGRENNELSFIRGHLTHGIVDIVTSLIGVAVPINSAILILAAAVFFKSNGESSMPASLFDAHQLIVDRIGNAAGVVFALALLFAGQTSSITATLAGQVVSEGFIEWHISPFLRRLVTRMIGLVPSMVVAIAVGRTGINTLLVASQVALSVVLPFVAFPLIWLTSSKSIMSVRVPHKSDTFSNTTHVRTTMTLDMPPSVVATQDGSSIICESVQEVERPLPEKADDVHVENVAVSPDDDEYIDFSNGRLLTLVSVLIFIIVLAANLYVFVMLGLGRT
ncbi:natural resistance-associated macrophage protein-domain-containing protein [Irpex lacteus]|nr:natural resistance-associated macrophage protein-domain-containing protein [Irpex lacteus]